MKNESFGDRRQLPLGSVFSQYLPDLGCKFLQGIDLGLIFNLSGIIFFSQIPYLTAKYSFCQKNVAIHDKIFVYAQNTAPVSIDCTFCRGLNGSNTEIGATNTSGDTGNRV